MKRNRSIPPAQVIPVLTYRDVRAAVDWLRAAFGITEHVWIGPNHRAQLMFGAGGIIAADATRERGAPSPRDDRGCRARVVGRPHGHAYPT